MSDTTLTTPPQPPIISSPPPLQTIIALTFSAANAQTANANPTLTETQSQIHTPTTISTSTPTFEIIPTSTIFIFELQTEVSKPTLVIYPTNTQSVINTIAPSTDAVCSCDGGLDCKDFETHDQAQACYEYCVALGFGDVHGIDGNDKDGLACESLP